MFQSTHPHGVRPDGGILIPLTYLFQSTHPHGVRHFTDDELTKYLNVSIHAPARGATAPG